MSLSTELAFFCTITLFFCISLILLSWFSGTCVTQVINLQIVNKYMKVKRGVTSSLSKKPTFWATNVFNVFQVGNECRNSILMMCDYPDMGNASDLLCCKGNLH